MRYFFIAACSFLAGVISSLCGIGIATNPAIYLLVNIPLVIIIVLIAGVLFPDKY